MSTQNIIFIVVVLAMFFAYILISHFIKYKIIKEDNEKHLKFLDSLKLNDRVILSSGILGTLVGKNDGSYLIEISDGVIVNVLPRSIVGKI